MTKKYKIEIDCANCALKVESEAKKIKGIKDVSINFIMSTMTIEYDDNFDTSKVFKELIKVCKKIEPDFEIN